MSRLIPIQAFLSKGERRIERKKRTIQKLCALGDLAVKFFSYNYNSSNNCL
jgi:hypothetical protein